MSTMSVVKKITGPREPAGATAAERKAFRLPVILFGAAAALLVLSMFLPYWQMTLKAPQYPQGLKVHAYVNRLEGDVNEIDGLNHYIGMRPLGEAAEFERSIAYLAVGATILLVLGAIFIHSKWSVLLVLPALLWPFLYLGDMYYWMRNFGLNLDPNAPLSSSIDPFVPPVLGVGKVGQFETVAVPAVGLWLALVACALILAGLYYQRRAYKPLVDAGQTA